MQGDRVKKLMFSDSDNVDKELKHNQYISSIDSHASHTKEECSSETLPKALRTQALTALTSNFGLVGLVR